MSPTGGSGGFTEESQRRAAEHASRFRPGDRVAYHFGAHDTMHGTVVGHVGGTDVRVQLADASHALSRGGFDLSRVGGR